MKKQLLLLFAFLCSVGMWAASGDEIKSPDNVVSGKSYYIKGVYTASKVDYTIYYGPADATKDTKISTDPVTDITKALPITFTKVSDTEWTLTTPNGMYVYPHTSNGQSYLYKDEKKVQLVAANTKEGSNKGIKFGPNGNYYFQCNTTSNKLGGYSSSQYGITLIEAEDLSGKTTTSLSFSTGSPFTVNIGESFTAPTLSATPSSILSSVTFSSSDTSVAEVNATTGAVTIKGLGTTTIKAAYAGDDTYKSSSATYVINVVDPNIKNATFDLSGNQYNWGTTNDGSVYFDGATYTPATEGDITLSVAGNVRMWGSTESSLRLYVDNVGTATIYSYGKGSITLKAAEGYVITKITFEGSSLTFTPNVGTYSSPAWTGLANEVTLEKGSNTPQIKKIIVTYRELKSHDLTIHSNGWSSLALDFNAEVPEGTSAYYASAKDLNGTEGTITLKRIEAGKVIPAGEGVIVKGTGKVTFVESTEEPVEITNLFSGTATEEATVEANSAWVLNSESSTADAPYFSLFTGTTIPVNKAYIPAEAVGGAKTLIFSVDDDVVTSISSVENTMTSGVAYNLAGQRVAATAKGIVIMNGKKYINK